MSAWQTPFSSCKSSSRVVAKKLQSGGVYKPSKKIWHPEGHLPKNHIRESHFRRAKRFWFPIGNWNVENSQKSLSRVISKDRFHCILQRCAKICDGNPDLTVVETHRHHLAPKSNESKYITVCPLSVTRLLPLLVTLLCQKQKMKEHKILMFVLFWFQTNCLDWNPSSSGSTQQSDESSSTEVHRPHKNSTVPCQNNHRREPPTTVTN